MERLERGSNKLIINPANGKLYRFYRVCRLEECEIEIWTNKKDHYFCCTDHQQEYWKRTRRGDRALATEVHSQRKDIDKIKEKLGIE